jgi:hypothetical protein
MRIREAQPSDTEALLLVESRFRSTLADVRGGREWLSTHRETNWAALFEKSDVTLIVAESELSINGLLVVRTDSEVARVELLCSPSPGDDVSAALLAQARSRASQSGQTRIVSYAFPGNRMEKNMYEEVGMKAVSLKMEGQL